MCFGQETLTKTLFIHAKLVIFRYKMKKYKSTLVVLLVLSLVLISLGGKVQIINGEDSLATATIQEEHFIVQKVMYAFRGYALFCSFNATRGYWVELNISSTGDNPYEVVLEITSANHGLIFNATADSLMQKTVDLNYDDAYNITAVKRPFYSTVTISGTVDLYHNETTNLTPSPSIPEFPSWIILPLFLIATLVVTFCSKRLRVGLRHF